MDPTPTPAPESTPTPAPESTSTPAPESAKKRKRAQVSDAQRVAQLDQLRASARERFLENRARMREIEEHGQQIEDFQFIHLANNFDYSSNFLPAECMTLIFSFLDHRALCVNVALVCRGWCVLSRGDHIWNHLYYRQFPKVQLSTNDVTSSNNNANDAPRGFSCWFDAFSSRFKLRVRWRKQQCQQLLHLGFTAQELQPAHNRAHGRRPAMYSPALVHEERGDELVSVPERYPITCVAMHGERLAAGDQAGRVVLWDLRTGQHSRVLTVHKAQIAAVVLNSQFLVAAGGPNGARVILWDAKNFALLGYLKPSKQHQQKKKKKKENQKDVEQQEQQQLELEQLDQQMEQQEQLEREQLEQLDQQDDLQQQAQVQQQQAVNRCVKAMKLVDNMLAILFHNGDVELWDLGAQKQIAKMQLRSGANDMDMVLQQGDNYQWLLDMNKRYLAAMMEDQKIHIFDLRFPQVCIKLIDLRIPESERCKLKPRQATQSSSANSPISHALSNFHALVGAPAAPVAAPPPTQNLLHISCLQLMGDEHAGAAGVIGICETEVDMQDGSSSSALKFLDIRTGREWIKLRVPCHNGSNQQHHNPQDLCTYFDQDKIVRAFDSETLVLDRRTGVPLNRVAIPRAGIQISAQACDELRMATATHVGGIVYRSFARSNLYWSELEGGRKLTE